MDNVSHQTNCNQGKVQVHGDPPPISLTIINNDENGPVDINHGNRYITLLDLCLGCYGVPHVKVNGTE